MKWAMIGIYLLACCLTAYCCIACSKVSEVKLLETKLQEYMDNNDSKLAKLQKDVDKLAKVQTTQGKRLIFLVTLLNENFAAIADGHPELVIFVERDWKIKRMPKYLDIHSNDMQWFKDFLDDEAISDTKQ